ncbi:exopolyphosphatase [Aestuariibacter sp. AA17]|uniref:Exopolyphosphatase n=1 Tax=Fluctibacter corallii TaxID=2984329 RepID=A0ABT3A8D9_9ALTE|nr:exopolyphosphatase [Aestuariibacter sp. AA17]MCV2884936.1 exopolyphosphatase [Aestuariibacter sp. AA17]
MPNPESVLENLEPRHTTKVAALDIGSNSFHLVVARIVAGSVQILHKVKQRVRLAEGLDENGILSDEAIERGLATLKIIADSISGFEPDSVRIVATYTLRKAKNAKVFIKAARDILPYPIEIISGTEEARLIYNGVAHTSHVSGKRLVIDIGGGSTEFIIGESLETKLLRSLQMGCVSYTKRFFKQGEIKKKAFDKAITAAQQELELIDEKYRAVGWQSCIATSGTAKIITILVQELKDNPLDLKVTYKDLQNLIKVCCDAGHSDKLEFEALSEDRRGVLAAGIAILTAAFKSLEITSLEYSPAALREGVIYEMEEQLSRPDIRVRTAESLATRYDVDTAQANRVLKTTMSIFDQCAKAWDINTKEHRSMLGWAALLHEIGLQINSQGVQRHSGYIIQNVDMPGFNQEQQALLSILVRFHRKKIRSADIPEFTHYTFECVAKLIAMLRIGVLLNIKRQDDLLPDIIASAKKDTLTLTFPEGWLDTKPIFSADLQREMEQITAVGIVVKEG